MRMTRSFLVVLMRFIVFGDLGRLPRELFEDTREICELRTELTDLGRPPLGDFLLVHSLGVGF